MKRTFTQSIFLLTLLTTIFSASTLQAQDQASNLSPQDNKNLIKWNFGALILKNYSFQYERAIGNKISVAAGFRFAPKSNVPFKSKLKDLIDDDDTWESIKDFKTGNIAITPEIRFYLGKGVFQGFYIAPFVRYAKYSAEVPYTFDVEIAGTSRTETIPLSGDVTALTGGLLFGAQWKLSKQFFLDWWIMGPNYGTSSGNISGNKKLSSEEQDALRESLEDLSDLPLVKTKYAVDGDGAKVDFDGPWAGLRAGLSIGFRF